jgi:hypothetical protein
MFGLGFIVGFSLGILAIIGYLEWNFHRWQRK